MAQSGPVLRPRPAVAAGDHAGTPGPGRMNSGRVEHFGKGTKMIRLLNAVSVLKAPLAGLAALLLATQAICETPAASSHDRNLKPEQAVANTLTVPSGSLSVRLGIGNPRGVYSIGDKLELSVETNRAAWVTVLNIGVDGTTTVLYPYLGGTDNLVRPGGPVWISGQDSGVDIRFHAPAGTDLVKAFASTAKVPLLDPAEITRSASRSGTARIRMRNLVPEIQETIDANADGIEWAVDTVAVTSVAGPVPVAEDFGQTVSVHEPFGLSIHTSKLVYGIGEPVQIAITSARDCSLTVYNIGTSGAVRRIFPHSARPGHLVSVGETVNIPGDDSNILLASVGPAGVESLLALCATEAAASLGAESELEGRLFPKVGDWTSLSARDLLVIATPGDRFLGHGETARAVAAILVR